MKTGAQASKPRSNYALFLGDLSIFCNEKDIEEAFAPYGEIVNIRIQRSKETSRALSYGFIEFSCETAAVSAMNELNGFVLKGRPLRIRWAAKRNQPVKSENEALQTAATIFVKFASQTGIIVTEEILREHFSVFGKVLDTTIRTITIDDTYNRSKGYGFVNFVNSTEEDGLAAAYRASAELQNTTVSGVNYRCEVGYKHQPQAQQGLSQARQMGRSDSDSVSASGYSMNASGSVSGNVSVSNASANVSTASRPGFLPAMSPKQMYSGNSVTSAGGASHSPSHSHSSSGPSSPHPAFFAAVNPQVLSSGASVHSVGSGSTGMYSQNSPYAPHSPHHPVSAIVSTISFVPSGNNSVYSQQSAQAQQQGMYAQAMPHGAYPTAPQQAAYYPQQQQQYMQQQQYYAQQQGYYAPAAGYAPQQAPVPPQQQYYAAPQQQQGYYGMPQQEYGAYYPAQQQMHPQAPQQGYYAPAQAVPMAPPAGNHGQNSRRPPPAAYEGGMHLTEQALHQHQGHGRSRRPSMGPAVPTAQNYAVHPQAFAQAQQDAAAPGPDGRRSQRNISNKSNISEITSATLNELQCDDDEEVLDEEEVQHAGSTDAANDASEYEATPDELAHALSSHLKSTLQTQADTIPPVAINCKLSARRQRRNVSGGSNTTEITAAVLYDLRQQEQRREQEEEEEGFIEPPQAPRCTTPVEDEEVPVKAVLFAPRARLTTTPEPFLPEIPLSGASKSDKSPAFAHTPGRRQSAPSAESAAVALPAKSISPFTLSASALALLQSESEAADAAAGKGPQRRSKRNISDRSNASDITAALAFMQVEYSEDHFRSLDDDGESFSSAEVSACVCGKAGTSSCPFGTTACSCVYSATC